MSWSETLLKAQNEVARYAIPYYKETYRPSEHFFWSFITRWMERDFECGPPKRILDIGCAYGTMLVYAKMMCPDCEVYGIDFTERHRSKELFDKWKINFALSNIEKENPPFERPFDYIFFTETMEHLCFQPLPTLTRIKDLMNYRAVLYISTPEAESCGRVRKYYQRLEDFPKPDQVPLIPPADDHIWQYNKEEMIQLLTDAMLRVVRFDYASGVWGRHFNIAATPI